MQVAFPSETAYNLRQNIEENVPLPLEVTKRIIRKCTEEDVDEPE